MTQRQVELGWSQKELATRLQLSPQYVNDIVQDRRNPINPVLLRKIANVMDIDFDVVCFAAGVIPPDMKGNVSIHQIKRAFAAMRTVLNGAADADTARLSLPAVSEPVTLTRKQSYQLGRQDRLDESLAGKNVHQCLEKHRNKKFDRFYLYISDYQNGWCGGYDEDMSRKYDEAAI